MGEGNDREIFRPDQDGCIRVAFLLLPEYSMTALMLAIEPMRVANRLIGKRVFEWQLLSGCPDKVTASNGLALEPCLPLPQAGQPTNLMVCASFNPDRYVLPGTVAWLRTWANPFRRLGAMDSGCHLLQAAGLLNGHRITLHWEAIPAFRERYPRLDISQALFEIDGNLITCAGGTAVLDLMLHVIQQAFGHQLAMQVCEQFIRGGMRQKSDRQRLSHACGEAPVMCSPPSSARQIPVM